MNRFFGRALVVTVAAGALAVTGCAKEAKDAAGSAPAATAQAPMTLPVSLNAVMVALVDHSSDPIWLDAYTPPKTDEGWRDLEYHAYQMAVSGKLIQIAGTGPSDAGWVTNPDWRKFAEEMSAAGMDALAAAKTKNVQALDAAGNRLVEACESCHKEFKPDLPSMGIYHKPDFAPGSAPKT